MKNKQLNVIIKIAVCLVFFIKENKLLENWIKSLKKESELLIKEKTLNPY